jgi:SAM-dependent methyltransferase
MTQAAEIESQAAYHRQLYAALYNWDATQQAARPFLGDESMLLRLGIDQLGHFGPRGVTLIAERLVATADRPLSCVIELGSGLGGTLRGLGNELAAREMTPQLFGVELVQEHCEVAVEIGRRAGQDQAMVVNADAQQLPFRSNSADAIFAVGSASHFAMAPVLVECQRVLRPGGVLAMTEEVSLRPSGSPAPSATFMEHHPSDVFKAASEEERRQDLAAVGLDIEIFESLVEWALPLLRYRVQMLQFMSHCATDVFGAEASGRIIGTLKSAADEYERGSLKPMLIVARRTRNN